MRSNPFIEVFAALSLAISVCACAPKHVDAGGSTGTASGPEQPRAEIKLESYRWDGEGPNALAKCRFQVRATSDAPVFIEVGIAKIASGRDMVTWECFDGSRWDRLDEFYVDQDGNPVGIGRTIGYVPEWHEVTKVEPTIVESTVRRCEVAEFVRLRCALRYYSDANDHGETVIYSDEFSLTK